MTYDKQHPITPPPELIKEWINEAPPQDYSFYIVKRAAQWGADQELEACCEYLGCGWKDIEMVDKLRADRRPKPPSLKEQALEELREIHIDPEGGVTYAGLELIRRALEALPDDL